MKYLRFYLLILFLISGCSSYEKHVKTPIKDMLTKTVNITINTEKNLNINSNNESSPLEIIIFETENKPALFNIDDYHKEKILSIEKYILQANNTKNIKIIKKKTAKFINIIANYQKNNNKNWFFSEEIKTDKDTKLILLINYQGIKKMKE